MREDWKKKQLGEIAEVGAGNPAPQGDTLFHDGIYPFFRTSDVGKIRFGKLNKSSDYLNEEGKRGLRLYPKGTILFPKSGASTFLNHRVILGVDGFVSSHLATIVADRTQVEPGYLLYFLSTICAQDLIQDHAYPSLNLGTISSIVISLPALAEQRRIVGILDETFAGLATARANTERNFNNANMILKANLEKAFDSQGDYPRIPIGEVAQVFDGPHATPKTIDNGPVFLGISALKDGQISFRETRHVSDEDYHKWTRRVEPKPDDVVFSYETRLGQAAIIPHNFKCCLGRRMGLVRANRRRLNPQYFVYQYISPPFRRFLQGKTIKGATVDRISVKEFPSFTIILPSLSIQEDTIEQIDMVRAETARLSSICLRKSITIDELRKTLLYQAFSGNL
jgi:type I restriction enzyme S subunit